MADIISRLRLESGEFDSKIKRAGQELMAYSEHCRKTGLQMGYANKDARDFAQSLGSMQTTSTTARGKINELSDAFVNLRMMYKQMTDEEKNNQFGKNLAASLDQLKTRIQEAKKDLSDVTAELNGASSGGKGGFLSGIGDKMGGAMQVFAGNMLTKGVTMLTSELAGTVQQSIELARQGEGIRIAFERLNQPGLLDNLKAATHGTVSEIELMKQAIKFENFKLPVEDLANYLAFAQQKAKDTGESIDFLVTSIVNGLGRQSKQILDNLGISAAELTSRMNEGATMTEAVSAIIKEEMAKAGDYVETAADRAARATAQAQDKAEAFGRTAMPVAEEWAETWATLSQDAMSFANTLLGPVAKSIRSIQNILNSGPDVDDYKNSLIEKAIAKAEEEKRKSANQPKRPTLGDVPVVKAPGGYVEVTDSRTGEVIGGRHFDNLEDKNAIKDWQKGLNKSTRTSGSRPTAKKEQTELQQNQTRINELTQQYVTLMAAASEAGKPLTDEQQKQTSEIQRQISELEKRNGQLKLYQEQAQGKLLGPDAFRQQLSVDVAVNNKKIEELEKQLLSLNGITIDPKTVTITATDDALPKLREIQGITIDPKTVTITATDEALQKLREIDGITIDDKTMTVTAETADALRALQAVEGVTIGPKTVTITATDEALPKLREIQGITIDDKTMTVTADTQEALQALQAVDGVTIDTKNVKVTAETDEAKQKVEELKRQIAELKDQNLMINAGMASLDLQNARDLSRTGGVTGFVGTGKSAMPVEGLPSMSDVVRQRGGNLLDDKAMKAVNEDISRKKDSPMESGKKLLNGISQLTDGLEKIGIDIPDEIQSVITVIQGVMQVIEAVNTIIGVTQMGALGANTFAMGLLTEALWANTYSSFFGLQNGGIVPKFAGGGVVPKFADGGLVGRAALGIAIPGNSMSGDNLRLPVDGGRGVIGVNSGEVILNRAQQGVIASALDGGGASQNLKLDAVISGEQIRLVLNNNGRRTGRGEYVQSTRRRG